MKGVIDGLKDFQKLLDAIQTNQIVKKYMSSHNLVGKEIFNNSCYHVEFSNNETVVYLNYDIVAA